MKKLFSIVALVALVVGLLPSNGAAQAQQPSPDYGASVFLLGHPETTQRDIDLVKKAGLHWIKLAVPWRSIEASCKNCIDWSDLDRVVGAASAAGLNILARVDHQPDWSRAVAVENGPPDDTYDYADFVSVLAKRYRAGSPKGTIQAIEVWNEPNLSREWGGAVINRDQAAQYMYMLKQTYQAVKAEDPSKIVVSAGLSPTGTNDGTAQPDDVYLGWLYEFGLAESSDAIGMHGAGYGNAPEAAVNSDPRFPDPSFYFRRIEQLHNIMVAQGDTAKQVWLLEFGWTTDQVNPQYSWYAVTPEQQADYIVRAFKYAKSSWSPWIGPMFVWNIADPSWTPDFEQYWWSITNPDGTTRPAYDALSAARASGALP
ncbi:MAG: cellulase family glycosylhydrolase [Chloroflexi bacterium]|nr:cellulase family glycosylhydrolase [Chloroflexota bacterium]